MWLIAALVAVGIIVGVTGSGDDAEPEPAPPEPAASTALDQMNAAFRGNPSVDLIEDELRTSFDQYGLPWTEDNRSRAGSVLVTLEDELDVAEMAILRLMNCSPEVAEQNLDWPEAAAMAGAFVAAGDTC